MGIVRPPASDPGVTAVPAVDGPASQRVAALRGADAIGVEGHWWTVVGALGLVVIAAVLTLSVVSAANDNGRISRMKEHGVAVTATVTSCVGNLGGSGSNGAGYTCRGHYVVEHTSFDEVIGAMTTFAAPGSHVAVTADPARLSTIELTSAVVASRTSARRYVVPGALGVGLLVVTLALVRGVRRRGARHAVR
ncbi:MAG: hypothetical protein KGI65_06920 [Acidobacteriota bacterium]|nr:hypothetical protein [Acidobacteriota bacterium]